MGLVLGDIARIVGGKVVGDERLEITGVNSLEAAGDGDLSFLVDSRYKKYLAETRASAVIVAEKTGRFQGAQVIVDHPSLAYAKVAGLFAPPIARFPGISTEAVVHESSIIGENVSIYPSVYVGEEAVIGDEAVLFPGVFVGERVRLGRGTVIHPNVSILHDSVIGENVTVHAGTVIGSDGFGFVREGARSVKIPQLGIVQIDDDVEIGANNCIDRAALGKTWIKRGVKTDNLVQVGHNVVVGEDTVVVAQTGISGSVEIGDRVVIGGQVGIADHLQIGDDSMIGSQAGIAKSIPPGEVVSGTPALPHRRWLRSSHLIARLPELNERVNSLEKRIESLLGKQPEEKTSK